MNTHLVKTLLPYVKPHWKKGLSALFLAVVLAALKWAQAALVKPVFDQGLSENGSMEETLVLAGLLMLIMVVNFPARFFHFYWIRYIVDKATCQLRSNIYEKIQRLPISYFNQNKLGVLTSNIINDTQTFSGGFRASIDLVREPLYAIALLGLAFYRDWALTMIIFIVAPMFLVIFSKSGKSVKKNQADVQEELGNLTHNIGEGLGGQKITKAFNLQNFIMQRFEGTQNKFFNSLMKTTWVEEMAHPLVEFVGGLAFAGIIVFAHYRIKSGVTSPGDFVSFVTAMALFMDPIRKLSQANIKLSQADAAEKRISKLLNLPEEIDEGVLEHDKFLDKLTVTGLDFSYGDHKVLKDFNFEVKKGQKVALVGLSGSGKSTLINLLLGLYRPCRGEIRIDGVCVDKIKLKSLRNLFGLVSQDIFLFHDSVKDNLTLGKNYPIQEITRAIDVAYAGPFIDRLPQGLDTLVGDRGVKLSGGQQQRLTIARAFLQNTDILLFDEATSALDNESERMVQKALDQISKDKTVIAVAHRLSTIQDFDQIYVLSEGVLVERGTHEQLMANGGEYFKLYNLGQK